MTSGPRWSASPYTVTGRRSIRMREVNLVGTVVNASLVVALLCIAGLTDGCTSGVALASAITVGGRFLLKSWRRF